MMRYSVNLKREEIEELQDIINKGNHTSQTLRTAYILLNCDESPHSQKVTNEQISKVLKVGMRTIDRVKKKFSEEGFNKTLERRLTRRKYRTKITENVEAKLVTLCCSAPPKGYTKWSLRLLAEKMTELNYVDSISYVSISNMLKKLNLRIRK